MNKEQWIKLVSKIEDTFEDEFRGEYNSPELMWEKIISKLKLSKKDALIINQQIKLDYYEQLFEENKKIKNDLKSCVKQ